MSSSYSELRQAHVLAGQVSRFALSIFFIIETVNFELSHSIESSASITANSCNQGFVKGEVFCFILSFIFDMKRVLLQPANKLLQPAN